MNDRRTVAPIPSAILDKLLLCGLVILAALPFPQLLSVSLGFAVFNLGEILQIILALLALMMIIQRGIVPTSFGYVFLAFSTFLVYLFGSLALLDVAPAQLIVQTRHFLPFLLALLVLLVRIYIDVGTLLYMTAAATAVSASLALLIHSVFPQLIRYAFASSEEIIVLSTEAGRMYWGGASLTFFCVTAVLASARWRWQLRTALAVAAIGIIFTQNRTLPLGLVAYYFLASATVFKRGIRSTIGLAVFGSLAIGVYFLVASVDMMELLQRRLFLSDDSSSEFEHAFYLGRIANYEQYLNLDLTTFLIGQGLGRPLSFSWLSDAPIFTSDISFVSFILPFGIPGLSILGGFVWAVLKRFKIKGSVEPKTEMAQVFTYLVAFSLAVSLNYDLFSRNIFVIYLAVFAAAFSAPRRSITYVMTAPRRRVFSPLAGKSAS